MVKSSFATTIFLPHFCPSSSRCLITGPSAASKSENFCRNQEGPQIWQYRNRHIYGCRKRCSADSAQSTRWPMREHRTSPFAFLLSPCRFISSACARRSGEAPKAFARAGKSLHSGKTKKDHRVRLFFVVCRNIVQELQSGLVRYATAL